MEARATVQKAMQEKEDLYGSELMRMAEKSLLLQLLDQHWKDHLLALDHLRQGISLRAYGQKDPLNEYKREAFDMFEEMLDRLRESVTGVLSHLQIQIGEADPAMPQRQPQRMQESRVDPALAAAMAADGPPAQTPGGTQAGPLAEPGSPFAEDEAGGPYADGDVLAPPRPQPVRSAAAAAVIDPDDPSTWGKVGRNQPCPCGTGKKYKQCHGKVT